MLQEVYVGHVFLIGTRGSKGGARKWKKIQEREAFN